MTQALYAHMNNKKKIKVVYVQAPGYTCCSSILVMVFSFILTTCVSLDDEPSTSSNAALTPTDTLGYLRLFSLPSWSLLGISTDI
jgi:hypothetical protein